MSPTKDDERVELRVSADDLKRWRATAAVEGKSLSEWIRDRCNEVAVDQATIDLVEKRMRAEREARQRENAERAENVARGNRARGK